MTTGRINQVAAFTHGLAGDQQSPGAPVPRPPERGVLQLLCTGGDSGRSRLPISSVAHLTGSPRGTSATEVPPKDTSRKCPPRAAETEGRAPKDPHRLSHTRQVASDVYTYVY